MTWTSAISGTFVKRQRSPVSVAAASSFSAAFLEPLTGTSPRSGRPPSIADRLGLDRRLLVLPVERARVRHARYVRRRGPSRCRRSATRMRRSARSIAARARARSAGSSKPCSIARSASRRAASAASRSISDARSASSAMTTTLSGRTWRNPPAIAKDSSWSPFRMRSSPEAERREQRGVMRQDADLALGARADDGVDDVRVGLPLGRDDLEQEGHR